MLFFKSSENATYKGEKFRTLITSTIIAYIISLIMLFIISVIITYTNISESLSMYFVKATTYISAMISGFISAGKIAKKGWMSGAISGGCYAVVLFIISTLIRKTSIDISNISMVLICILTGIVGGIIGINTKSQRK